MEYSTPADAKTVKFVQTGQGIVLGIADIQTQTMPLGADVKSVRLCGTADCFVAIFPNGGTVASDGTDLFLPANKPEYLMVPLQAQSSNSQGANAATSTGSVIACIMTESGATGDLYIMPAY